MDDLAANGFTRRSLHKAEARALFEAWYPCPPDMRAGSRFTIGVSGVPIPDPPRRSDTNWGLEVLDHFYYGLTDEQRAQPEWYPDNPANYERYDAAFRRIHRERLNRWDGPGLPPSNQYNHEGRRAFWGVRGRTLAYVIAHIAAGDQPRLETPAPAAVWAPRRSSTQSSTSSSSRSTSSSSRSPYASMSAPPQVRAPKSARGVSNYVYDNNGALVINNNGVPIRSASRRPPPPSSAKKPKQEVKTEPSTYEVLVAFQQAHATADDPEGVAPAIEASRNTMQPMSDRDASAWSVQQHLMDTGAPLIDLGDDSDSDFDFGPGANDDEAGSSNPPDGGVKKEKDVFWRYR